MGKEDNKNDYEVGYGRPPKNRQFGQPDGNSPNKKGRPPGRNSREFGRLSEELFWDTLLEVAQTPVTYQEAGEHNTVPAIMAIIKVMTKAALEGNIAAQKELLRYIDRATKAKDSMIADLHMAMADHRERKLMAMRKPGSLECFSAYCGWYMVKVHLRAIEGADHWIYEDGEPISYEDWGVFLKQYEFLQKNPEEQLPWPVKYACDIEQERLDNMTREERAQEQMKEFKHRKEMREKEGKTKWPYWIEEPVTDQDWEHFEQHIDDIISGKDNHAPWPPAYCDDEPEE